MQLLNQVAKMRKNMQLTQDQLAQKVAVSRQTIIAIEKGNYTPSLLLTLKLARFFGCTVEALFQLEVT